MCLLTHCIMEKRNEELSLKGFKWLSFESLKALLFCWIWIWMTHTFDFLIISVIIPLHKAFPGAVLERIWYQMYRHMVQNNISETIEPNWLKNFITIPGQNSDSNTIFSPIGSKAPCTKCQRKRALCSQDWWQVTYWFNLSCIWVHLFQLFWFPKFWSKFYKVWPNFDLKNVFLQTQNGFSQDGLIPKVWTFYLAPVKSYSTNCPQNSKANLSVALQPLKLQIAEKVLRPMKFRPKASVFTNPHPFWKVVVPIQVLWSHSSI